MIKVLFPDIVLACLWLTGCMHWMFSTSPLLWLNGQSSSHRMVALVLFIHMHFLSTCNDNNVLFVHMHFLSTCNNNNRLFIHMHCSSTCNNASPPLPLCAAVGFWLLSPLCEARVGSWKHLVGAWPVQELSFAGLCFIFFWQLLPCTSALDYHLLTHSFAWD